MYTVPDVPVLDRVRHPAVRPLHFDFFNLEHIRLSTPEPGLGLNRSPYERFSNQNKCSSNARGSLFLFSLVTYTPRVG